MNFQAILQFLAQQGTTVGIKILIAIVILLVGIQISKAISKVVKKLLEKGGIESTLVNFLTNMSYMACVTFVVVIALEQAGIKTTSFIAILGAAGLAIGLALQGSLSNFASGVLLIIFRPFKKGDYIEAGGSEGIVQEITLFTTTLKSLDNKKIVVPNAKVSADNIINHFTEDNRMLSLVFGVGYEDDIDKVKSILAEILEADERILSNPKYTIGLLELADSSVNFAVRPWVKSEDYWPVHFDLHETIKKRFDAEGINIPYPQRDIHLYQKPSK